jgi:hypothetical protein
MAGTLSVQQIQGLASATDPTTVTIPAGHKLVASDTGGVISPGQVINFGSYNTGYGSGASLSSTSDSWQSLQIDGTNAAAFGSCSKTIANVITFNKKYNNSQLMVSTNFPTYNSPGGSGHGIRLQYYRTGQSAAIVDITGNGPAEGWGWHGYGGGNHSAMNNFTWSTYDNSSVRSDLQTYTGDVHFYIEVRNWQTSDTITYIQHTSYNKYGTFQFAEIAQ